MEGLGLADLGRLGENWLGGLDSGGENGLLGENGVDGLDNGGKNGGLGGNGLADLIIEGRMGLADLGRMERRMAG